MTSRSMDEKCVIYALSLDGFAYRYVGMTRQRLRDRFSAHRRAAAQGVDLPVYRWIRKHGIDNVVVTVICQVDASSLAAAETEAIASLRGEGHALLNCTSGGEGMLEPSAELRARLSAAAKGKKKSPEHAANIARAAVARRDLTAAQSRGRMHTAETIEKMSAVHRGKTISLEQREKMRQAALGQKHSPKTIAKISTALLGRPCTEEMRRKISEATTGKGKSSKGRPLSEEHKAKLRKPKTPEHRAKIAAARRAVEMRKREISDQLVGPSDPA